jgi:hypothetical protein
MVIDLMLEIQKKINFFNKNKKKLKSSILILGSGRWAKEIISEILNNFHNIKKIFIYTKYPDQLIKWQEANSLKTFYFVKKKDFCLIDCNKAIIANKNIDHYKSIIYLIKKNFDVLVEKPVFLNQKKIKLILKITKKNNANIILGMQYFYAYYFHYLQYKFIKDQRIKKIFFQWNDKKREVKNGMLKRHDKKISFIRDIFFHIYSILSVLKVDNNFILNKKFIIYKKNSFEIANKNNIIIKIYHSRNSFSRKRIIKFILQNNKKIILNFFNDKKIILKISKKIINIPKIYQDTTLKKQLLFFLYYNRQKLGKMNSNFKKISSLFEILNYIK